MVAASLLAATWPVRSALVAREFATSLLGVEARAETAAAPWAELDAFTAEGAGEACALAWRLPAGATAEARVRIVRKLGAAPADLDDGEVVALPEPDGAARDGASRDGATLDGPLPAGTKAHYRAGLVAASGMARSAGLAAAAVALEKAGTLAELVLTPKKKAVEIRSKDGIHLTADAVRHLLAAPIVELALPCFPKQEAKEPSPKEPKAP